MSLRATVSKKKAGRFKLATLNILLSRLFGCPLGKMAFDRGANQCGDVAILSRDRPRQVDEMMLKKYLGEAQQHTFMTLVQVRSWISSTNALSNTRDQITDHVYHMNYRQCT